MSIGRGGPPILGAPHLHDPNAPTLHTCVDCGYQMLLPAGLVAAAAEHHRRGCIGPKIADLAERVAVIERLIRHYHSEGE